MERLLATMVLMWLTRVAALALLALGLYYRWRVRRERAAAWLCACAMACAAWNAPFVLAAVSHPDDVAGILDAGRPDLLLMACVLCLLVLARRGARGRRRLRPLQVGLVIGLATSGIHAVWTRWGPEPGGPALLMVPAAIAFGLLTAWCLLGLRVFPRWIRVPAAVIPLGVSLSMALTGAGVDASVWRTGAGLLADTVVGGVVVFLAVRLFVATQAEQASTAEQMALRAQDAEAHLRADQEMLHELRSTMAGIASASRLLRHDRGELDPERAARLGQGLGREIDRIERLLRAEDRQGSRQTDLADAIAPVVECARASGLDVVWEPVHVHVHGQPDDLAEVVHILLDNARRHAPGSPVWITLGARWFGTVELRVRDAGPGVAPEVGGQLFGRGIHADESPGEGIGLYVAHRVLAEHGGTLALAPRARSGGAEFVVRLPGQQTPSTNGTVVPGQRRP